MARDYSKNDELNDFIAVELAQGTGRIMTRVHDRVYIAMEINKILARIVEKVLQVETETAKAEEKRAGTFKELFEHKQVVLDYYWDGKSDTEIGELMGVDGDIIQRVLNNLIPRNLIYEKYNSGMLPSRIGRLKAVNLSTNCVRRVLNMDPVEYK